MSLGRTDGKGDHNEMTSFSFLIVANTVFQFVSKDGGVYRLHHIGTRPLLPSFFPSSFLWTPLEAEVPGKGLMSATHCHSSWTLG